MTESFIKRAFGTSPQTIVSRHIGASTGRTSMTVSASPASNDEIWADMTTRPLHGPLRLGIPYDLVGTCFPPIFKAFAEACPLVEVSLMCGTSPELSRALANGSLDLAVIETAADDATGECLRVERLVWVGAHGGIAHLKRPLPISIVAESCAFRPVVLEALRENNLEWRTVFESGIISQKCECQAGRETHFDRDTTQIWLLVRLKQPEMPNARSKTGSRLLATVLTTSCNRPGRPLVSHLHESKDDRQGHAFGVGRFFIFRLCPDSDLKKCQAGPASGNDNAFRRVPDGE